MITESKYRERNTGRRGFSMPEMIITVAIIGILSTLVVNSISNINVDASRMMARQQQAAVQTAVNAWATAQMRDETTGQVRSTEQIRSEYNSLGHSLARLNKVAPYLDEITADHLLSSTTNTGRIKSDALKTAKQYLTMETWGGSSYPKVELVNE